MINLSVVEEAKGAGCGIMRAVIQPHGPVEELELCPRQTGAKEDGLSIGGRAEAVVLRLSPGGIRRPVY
jgi:hypothetical protein